MKTIKEFCKDVVKGCMWFGGFWFWLKVFEVLLGFFVFYSLAFVIVIFLMLGLCLEFMIERKLNV